LAILEKALGPDHPDVANSLNNLAGLYKDQGLGAVKIWLERLFTPYVCEAYRIVREQHGLLPIGSGNELQAAIAAHSPPTPPPETRRPLANAATLGHLGLFNQRLQQQNKSIEWVFDDTITESTKATPFWAAKAVVDGDCWGTGRGNTKKTAKNEAAKQGLKRMGFDGVRSHACNGHRDAATDMQTTGLLACVFRPVPEGANDPVLLLCGDPSMYVLSDPICITVFPALGNVSFVLYMPNLRRMNMIMIYTTPLATGERPYIKHCPNHPFHVPRSGLKASHR